MGKVKLLLCGLVFVIGFASTQIPLPTAPSWSSRDNDYSTGGAFGDIDRNGFLDFCISNGNDMAMDRNTVYFNDNGILEQTASWRSSDSGYFGHSYLGDVNNDGLQDLAVAYLGGYPSGGDYRARIYLNSGSGFNPIPWWCSVDRHTSFDCALGDFDLDGDLDLVISAGDVYGGRGDSARIYRNNNGLFDTLPCWSAGDSVPSDAVRFCDIDNDGDLDLFVGQRGKVTMYRNNDGVLEAMPYWVARQGIGWVLRMEFGDYDRDGFLDLAVASNGQMGDPNSIKVFHNNNGVLDTIAIFTMQRRNRYSSCVAWGDVNGDSYPELAAGGWWEPVVVYANNLGVIDTTPGWQWRPANLNNLVCEALLWTDVGNRHLVGEMESNNGNGRRRLFNLAHRPIQFLDSVLVNGSRLGYGEYCYDPHSGWVSFNRAPDSGTGNVVLFYRYSEYPDLAVTNWDRTNGNHLFMNTTTAGVKDLSGVSSGAMFEVFPNPSFGPVMIKINTPESKPKRVRIWTQDGRLVYQRLVRDRVMVWNSKGSNGEFLPGGIYIIDVEGARIKLVKLQKD